MERWLEAKQDRVWRGNRVPALEKHYVVREHDLLMKKAASLIVGNSVLDVGCGLGHLYEHVTRLNPSIEYLGLDQSADMLKRARVRHPDARFEQGNIYDMDPPKFDTVVCLDVLHHQPALYPALSILLKHARKALIVTIWIHERYKGGKHGKQYTGNWGEIITWHTAKELKERFSNLKYEVYRGIGWEWRDIYRFFQRGVK